MGWLPRLGLPDGAVAVLVGEVVLAAGVVLRPPALRQRRRPAASGRHPRWSAPPAVETPLLDLVCLGVPAVLAVTLGRAPARPVRRPTGLGRDEPRAADPQHPGDRQHRGGLGVHLRVPPPGGVLRRSTRSPRTSPGPRRPLLTGGPWALGDDRLGRLRGPVLLVATVYACVRVLGGRPSSPAPPRPRRPSSGRCTPRCSPAGPPSRPAPASASRSPCWPPSRSAAATRSGWGCWPDSAWPGSC